MRPFKVLLFIIFVFASLGVLGWIFPVNGVNIGQVHLSFPSPKEVLQVEQSSTIDVENTVTMLKSQSDLSQVNTILDSLLFCKKFAQNNVSRLHFPNNDYTYWDDFFALLASSSTKNRAIHIVHYGDSQIEMDRISSVFRHRLQGKFTGKGAGMVPPIQTIPSYTVRQSYAGNLSRYVVYGDTSQPRAAHRRYGILANLAQLNGEASITVGSNVGKRVFENTTQFNRIVMLIGNNINNFKAVCKNQTRSVSGSNAGVTRLTWDFDTPISQATLYLQGTAEIYAISMENKSGIVVDNVPMRGCSGTIFTRMDSATLAQCNANMNVKLIIMQYGGNMMPMINSQKSIDNYMQKIAKQIKYLKNINPQAEILFIGPSDMSKKIDGKMQTYPFLPALNEALKNTVLQNGGVFWDMFNVMGGKNSMISWVNHSPAWAGGDYIHFTEAGANEIANLLSEAFLLHYEFYALRMRCPEYLIEKFMKMN